MSKTFVVLAMVLLGGTFVTAGSYNRRGRGGEDQEVSSMLEQIAGQLKSLQNAVSKQESQVAKAAEGMRKLDKQHEVMKSMMSNILGKLNAKGSYSMWNSMPMATSTAMPAVSRDPMYRMFNQTGSNMMKAGAMWSSSSESSDSSNTSESSDSSDPSDSSSSSAESSEPSQGSKKQGYTATRSPAVHGDSIQGNQGWDQPRFNLSAAYSPPRSTFLPTDEIEFTTSTLSPEEEYYCKISWLHPKCPMNPGK